MDRSIQPVLNGLDIEATLSKKMNAMARRAGQAGRAGFAAGEGSLVIRLYDDDIIIIEI